MKTWTIASMVMLAACDAGISPDPTSGAGAGSSASGSTSTSSGSTSTGTGTPNKQGNESGSRLKVRTLVATDGAQEQLGFHDQQRNEDCSFRLASDGTTRCMPFPAIVSSFYSDPGCVTKLVGVSPCGMPGQYAQELFYSDMCSSPATRVYHIGAKFTGQVYQMSGACVPTTASGSLFTLGPEVAPSEFVQATEMLEP
jgi:hypothetical protein